MLLLVGLGNPGPRYARNRHNIGFMAVDAIVRRHGFGPWRKRFNAQLAEGSIAGQKVLALKPETFMNESGRAVGKAVQFYKLTPDRVLVVYDEIDLQPGKIRIKTGGGSGGHNGIRSIDSHIGANYRRLRLGVGHPGDKDRVHGHVLSDFSKQDQAWLETLLDALADEFPRLFEGDDLGFMSRVSNVMTPPKPKDAKPPVKADRRAKAQGAKGGAKGGAEGGAEEGGE
ncbi:MAG: aminoacyl-tRNA hydrolase [Kiloniellales bacterium]